MASSVKALQEARFPVVATARRVGGIEQRLQRRYGIGATRSMPPASRTRAAVGTPPRPRRVGPM